MATNDEHWLEICKAYGKFIDIPDLIERAVIQIDGLNDEGKSLVDNWVTFAAELRKMDNRFKWLHYETEALLPPGCGEEE